MSIPLLLACAATALSPPTGAVGTKGASGGDAETALAYCRLAHTYYRARRYDKALEQIEGALRYAPDNPRILYAAGVVLFALERYDEAFVNFRLAARHAAAPPGLRDKAENGIVIIERIRERRRRRWAGRVVSWGALALVAASVPLAIRAFTRFLRLAERRKQRRAGAGCWK